MPVQVDRALEGRRLHLGITYRLRMSDTGTRADLLTFYVWPASYRFSINRDALLTLVRN